MAGARGRVGRRHVGCEERGVAILVEAESRSGEARSVGRAAAAMAEAAAGYGSVRGAWYPTFGLNAALVYQRDLFPGGPDTVLDFRELSLTPGAELSYVLLDFGRRRSSDAQARASLWVAVRVRLPGRPGLLCGAILGNLAIPRRRRYEYESPLVPVLLGEISSLSRTC